MYIQYLSDVERTLTKFFLFVKPPSVCCNSILHCQVVVLTVDMFQNCSLAFQSLCMRYICQMVSMDMWLGI